jgi:hypothetical protein
MDKANPARVAAEIKIEKARIISFEINLTEIWNSLRDSVRARFAPRYFQAFVEAIWASISLDDLDDSRSDQDIDPSNEDDNS